MGYQQFTLAQMRALAYEQLGGDTVFYRDDEIDRYIRQALRMWNVLAGFWRGSSVLDPGTLTANQVWYTVPSAFAYLLRVEVLGKPLGSSSLWDLDYGSPTWESDVVGVGNAPSVVTCWAPAGLNMFAIWPASALGTESVSLYGVVKAPQPVLDNDFVDIGREDLEHVLDYVEHLCAFKEGGQEAEAATEMLQSFLKAAGERNSMLMASSRFRGWMGLTDERKRPIRAAVERVGAR